MRGRSDLLPTITPTNGIGAYLAINQTVLYTTINGTSISSGVRPEWYPMNCIESDLYRYKNTSAPRDIARCVPSRFRTASSMRPGPRSSSASISPTVSRNATSPYFSPKVRLELYFLAPRLYGEVHLSRIAPRLV